VASVNKQEIRVVNAEQFCLSLLHLHEAGVHKRHEQR